MEENTLNVYKEYISSLQDQLTIMNTKLDNLQNAVEVCKDSLGILHTNIAENTNYWSIITSTNGVIVIRNNNDCIMCNSIKERYII